MRLIGPFHGMMAPTTPTGSRTSRPNPLLLGCRLLLPLERVGQPGVVVEGARGTLGRVLGDPVEHPGLARPDLPDLLRTRCQPGSECPQELRPLAVCHPGPWTVVEGLPGGGHGPGHVLRLGLGHTEEVLLGARVDHVDGGVRARVPPILRRCRTGRRAGVVRSCVPQGHGDLLSCGSTRAASRTVTSCRARSYSRRDHLLTVVQQCAGGIALEQGGGDDHPARAQVAEGGHIGDGLPRERRSSC